MSEHVGSKALPDWERVLSSAARLQRILPDAVLVGGTAAGLHVGHRVSRDADHVLSDLRSHFDEVLGHLESVAGWKTARVNRPVLILGSLDGVETGIRQLIRTAALETTSIAVGGVEITIPTKAEILRIKGFLLLRRNATRDYVDFAALADALGDESSASAFEHFDRLYPQASGESALQQMLAQLASPQPYDLEGGDLSEYNDLRVRWHDWNAVRSACAHAATVIFEHRCVVEEDLDKEVPVARTQA